jgi:hypothetical protein
VDVASADGLGIDPKIGPFVSITLMCNVAVDELPLESLALHVTTVSPRSNVDPDGGEQSTPTGPSTTSVADAEYVAVAPKLLVASTGETPDIEISGGVVSDGGGGTVVVDVSVEVASLEVESVDESAVLVSVVESVVLSVGVGSSKTIPTRSTARLAAHPAGARTSSKTHKRTRLAAAARRRPRSGCTFRITPFPVDPVPRQP